MTDTDKEIRAQVDEFVALPRAERRAKYASLPHAVKLRARKVIEARRGIAYRAEGGVPVLTKDAYIAQILRLQEKRMWCYQHASKRLGIEWSSSSDNYKKTMAMKPLQK